MGPDEDLRRSEREKLIFHKGAHSLHGIYLAFSYDEGARMLQLLCKTTRSMFSGSGQGARITRFGGGIRPTHVSLSRHPDRLIQKSIKTWALCMLV